MPTYEMMWRNKWLTSEAKTIDDMILKLRAAADALTQMRDAGVILDDGGGTGDDYARLVTEDPEVAWRFQFEEDTCKDEEAFVAEDEAEGEA